MADLEVIEGFRVHPVASKFPNMRGDEFRNLVLDIKKHGVREPIKVTADGLLVDGRNRVRAAVKAGLDVKDIPKETIEDATEEELESYIFSENVSRRHLSDSQKAAYILKQMKLNGELDKLEVEAKEQESVNKSEASKRKARGEGAKGSKGGLVAETVTKRAKVGKGTALRMARMQKKDPEQFEKVLKGEKKTIRAPRSKARMPNTPVELSEYLIEEWSTGQVRKLVEKLSAFLLQVEAEKAA